MYLFVFCLPRNWKCFSLSCHHQDNCPNRAPVYSRVPPTKSWKSHRGVWRAQSGAFGDSQDPGCLQKWLWCYQRGRCSVSGHSIPMGSCRPCQISIKTWRYVSFSKLLPTCYLSEVLDLTSIMQLNMAALLDSCDGNCILIHLEDNRLEKDSLGRVSLWLDTCFARFGV